MILARWFLMDPPRDIFAQSFIPKTKNHRLGISFQKPKLKPQHILNH
jgi:hypothetical protein